MAAGDLPATRKEYLSKQLIAYIGNKRRLLPSLEKLFTLLGERMPVATMIDPFAGSGAVSRLGRAMGFTVYANDWEEYSRIINRSYLTLSPAQAEGLFGSVGGLGALIRRLNSLTGEPENPYFSRYFAPAATSKADYRTERLFYTRENGLFLDRVREWIENEYPPEGLDDNESAARELLIALLLYEAATHANTSGVFKAFHKGFGGHGGDALGRIMRPMSLEYPVLIDGPPAEVGAVDAARWVRGRSADLCYLDPPYTIHQYGSNYHLLNTLARWDRPAAPLELGSDGRLKRKAGIRPDWVETRSAFCSSASAAAALGELLEGIDARFLVLSYNSDGLIPISELTELLSRSGRLEMYTEGYIQYRGGKQGLNRRNSTTEFQLLLTRGAEHKRADADRLRRTLLLREAATLIRSYFHPRRLAALGCYGSGALVVGNGPDAFPTLRDWRFSDELRSDPPLTTFSTGDLEGLCTGLRQAQFQNNAEEARLLIELVEVEESPRIRREMFKRFVIVLKKLAHKKYRSIFYGTCDRAEERLGGLGWYNEEGRRRLEEIRAVAERRFTGLNKKTLRNGVRRAGLHIFRARISRSDHKDSESIPCP